MDIIRDNRPFGSVDELKNQITKDVNHVRAHWQSLLYNPEEKASKRK